MRRKPVTNIRQVSGLTLIEILVTLLVMSIGLLGIAGLHSFSLRSNFDALMRSHASALASEIADRMRANRSEVYTAGTSNYTIALADAPPAVTVTSPQSTRDVAAWLGILASQLPSGDGRISIDQTTRIVTVEVQWGERGSVVSFVTETVI